MVSDRYNGRQSDEIRLTSYARDDDVDQTLLQRHVQQVAPLLQETWLQLWPNYQAGHQTELVKLAGLHQALTLAKLGQDLPLQSQVSHLKTQQYQEMFLAKSRSRPTWMCPSVEMMLHLNFRLLG